MSRESKRLKKSSGWLNSGNALIQHLWENAIFYYGDMWRNCWLCLSCEDIARQSCAMVPRWRFFCVLYFQRAACSTFQTCILNSHCVEVCYSSNLRRLRLGG